MFVKNKGGWVRIFEAILSIMILFSVLIVLYANDAPEIEFSSYVGDLQRGILQDASLNEEFRNHTLNSSIGTVPQQVSDFIEARLPSQFNFTVTICELNSLNTCLWENSIQKEIYVEERIISSNFWNYRPRMVRLYVWEK